jgi:hypothetical protein
MQPGLLAACLTVQFSAVRQLRFWLLIVFLFFSSGEKGVRDAVQIVSSSIHQRHGDAFGRSLGSSRLLNTLPFTEKTKLAGERGMVMHEHSLDTSCSWREVKKG